MAQISTRGAQTPSPNSRLALGQLLNLPNLLTLLRLFAIPVFLALLSENHYKSALYLFIAAAITDALDGTVARWCNCKTEIGAVLDPAADKLLLVSAFVVLTFQNSLPGWLLGVVVIRDVVIVFGYFLVSFLTSERIPVRPSYLGKASTCFQLSCVVGALAHFGQYSPTHWMILLYLTCAITALSGMHYAYRGLVWLASHEPQLFA